MDIRQLLAPAPEAASTPLIRGTCDGRRESWTSASGGDLSSVQFAQQQRIMLHRRRTRKLGGGDESVENFGVRTRDGKEICARCRHLRMKSYGNCQLYCINCQRHHRDLKKRNGSVPGHKASASLGSGTDSRAAFEEYLLRHGHGGSNRSKHPNREIDTEALRKQHTNAIMMTAPASASISSSGTGFGFGSGGAMLPPAPTSSRTSSSAAAAAAAAHPTSQTKSSPSSPRRSDVSSHRRDSYLYRQLLPSTLSENARLKELLRGIANTTTDPRTKWLIDQSLLQPSLVAGLTKAPRDSFMGSESFLDSATPSDAEDDRYAETQRVEQAAVQLEGDGVDVDMWIDATITTTGAAISSLPPCSSTDSGFYEDCNSPSRGAFTGAAYPGARDIASHGDKHMQGMGEDGIQDYDAQEDGGSHMNFTGGTVPFSTLLSGVDPGIHARPPPCAASSSSSKPQVQGASADESPQRIQQEIFSYLKDLGDLDAVVAGKTVAAVTPL